MKKVLCLLLSLIASSLFSMQLNIIKPEKQCNKFKGKLVQYVDVKSKMHIKPTSVFVPERLGSLDLYHNNKGFYVKQDDKKHHIKKYFTDKILHDINKKQLKSFLETGYLSINQMNDGEYSLKAKLPLNGGGVLGAAIGAFLGKAVVSIVGHGAIAIVSICSGPAAIPTAIALESWFGAAIEAASIKGAIAGGIALGVATGPV